jgi:hypothetical protein
MKKFIIYEYFSVHWTNRFTDIWAILCIIAQHNVGLEKVVHCKVDVVYH